MSAIFIPGYGGGGGGGGFSGGFSGGDSGPSNEVKNTIIAGKPIIYLSDSLF